MTDFFHRLLYKKLNYVVYAGTLCDLCIDCRRNDPNETICCIESTNRNHMSTVGRVYATTPRFFQGKTAGKRKNAETFPNKCFATFPISSSFLIFIYSKYKLL
jgi:hypothetical protein